MFCYLRWKFQYKYQINLFFRLFLLWLINSEWYSSDLCHFITQTIISYLFIEYWYWYWYWWCYKGRVFLQCKSVVRLRDQKWFALRPERKRNGGRVLGSGDNGQGYVHKPATPWLQGHCLEQDPLQGIYFHYQSDSWDGATQFGFWSDETYCIIFFGNYLQKKLFWASLWWFLSIILIGCDFDIFCALFFFLNNIVSSLVPSYIHTCVLEIAGLFGFKLFKSCFIVKLVCLTN